MPPVPPTPPRELLVDMGLPSGTKWAKFDIDVNQPDGFCASEFQYEKSFFSWGNVDGHNPVDNSFVGVYNWTRNEYNETNGSQLTQDIPQNAEYDAAYSNLGENWHIPSFEQFIELFENVDYLNADGTIKDESETNKLITLNNTIGIWIQSKINGNKLFFSCSGDGNGTTWSRPSTFGFYWSSTYNTETNARSLGIAATGVSPEDRNARYYGFAIRPVQG